MTSTAAADNSELRAPGLELDTDPERPYPSVAVTADPLGPLAGRYELRAEFLWHRSHGAWLSPEWLKLDGVTTVGLFVGYHLWLLGSGVRGVYFGPSLGLSWDPKEGRPIAGTVAIEAGYQHVWYGIVIGLGVRYSYVRRFERENGKKLDHRIPAVLLSLGYSW